MRVNKDYTDEIIRSGRLLGPNNASKDRLHHFKEDLINNQLKILE